MIDLDFSTGDLALNSDNDIATVSEGDQVVSHVSARLKTILGEDYFDATKGVPWFDGIFTIATTYDQKVAIIRQTILKTPGVARIVRFSFGIDQANRQATVEYQAETIYSTSISDEVLL